MVVFPRFEYRSRESLFHALDCSMRLLGEITVLLGVHKLRILAVGDCLTDVSTIVVFACKNHVVLAEFQHIDYYYYYLFTVQKPPYGVYSTTD